ncbi:UDP-N-acetylmuramoyl-tripeptide--D-alanyl-D-alanine ligase [hydrothermal vent metagenome]|uniref:UDP-MurNAc-pentapeptide synthetase n=1 Tax=hydrothermal vent metagenome TaxID=652676 RepID=A0A3B0QWR2_9ZZZZ
MNIKTLHNLFLKYSSVCTDTRKITGSCMFFALKGDTFNGNTFASKAIENGAKYAIVDDKEFALSENYILVEDVLTTLQQLANYHRTYLGLKIIALTGSNGKTTTKELIHSVLQKKYRTVATIGNLNNHIGVPLTLLAMHKDTEIGIVEMGANHLHEIEALCQIANPDYGYITNFGKAHLEGFGSIEGVIKGKSELYNHLKENSKLIFINAEDATQIKQLNAYKHYYTFGSNSENDVTLTFIDANPFVNTKFKNLTIESHLIGAYNFNNISVAIAIGHYFEISDNDIKNAIESYIPKDNRSQIIKKDTNTIILDAYNANPTSMIAALLNFEKQTSTFKIAILGDMFELGDAAEKEHQYIVDLVSTMLLDNVILIGEHFYKTKIVVSKIIAFKSFEDFKVEFDTSKIKNTSILIKGSRGMALERVLELL